MNQPKTYTDIAFQLFRHGPLTTQEFRLITGWKSRQCDSALNRLRITKRIRRVDATKYRLADWTKEL